MTSAVAPINALQLQPPTMAGVEKPVQFKPPVLLDSPDDFFAMSLQAIDQQTLGLTNQAALKAMLACQGRADYINLAQSKGLVVFDGQTHENAWVNDYLKALNSKGFVYTPFNKRYKIEKQESQPFPKTGIAQAKDFEQASTLLSQTSQQGLFVADNTAKDVLIHELYHVFQQQHGLPFGVSPKADAAVEEFCDSLRKPSFKGVIKLAKLISLSGLLAISGNVVKPDKNTPFSLSFLRHHHRELEANQFVIQYGKALGLSTSEIRGHKAHALQNKMMSFLASGLAYLEQHKKLPEAKLD